MKTFHVKSALVACKHTVPSGFKFAADGNGGVRGYGSTFGAIDSYGERVLRGAFLASLEQHRKAGTMPLMLWQHAPDEPIGRWTAMAEDEIGLRCEGQFNLQTSRGRDAYQHCLAGDVGGLSIGYSEIKVRQNGDVKELVELDLKETSVVSFPANRSARITGVKCESRADLERLLREGGLPRAAAVMAANGGWPMLSGEQPTPEIEAFAKRLDAAHGELLKLKGLFS